MLYFKLLTTEIVVMALALILTSYVPPGRVRAALNIIRLGAAVALMVTMLHFVWTS